MAAAAPLTLGLATSAQAGTGTVRDCKPRNVHYHNYDAPSLGGELPPHSPARNRAGSCSACAPSFGVGPNSKEARGPEP